MLMAPDTCKEVYERVVYKLAGKSFVGYDWEGGFC